MAVHYALDQRGVTAIDLSNAVERSQVVAKTIKVCFELLRLCATKKVHKTLLDEYKNYASS